MARIWMSIDINWNLKYDCHSHICEPLFSNHSKTNVVENDSRHSCIFSCWNFFFFFLTGYH